MSRPGHTTTLRALSDQRGIVLPITLMMTLLISSLGLVAARAGIVSTHVTQRDANTKRAVAAAAAGIKAAIYETNMAQPSVSQCVTKNATTGALGKTAVNASGWCPQALTEDLGDGASYSVQVSSSSNLTINGAVTARRRIVSTGTVNGLKRRVATYVTSATGAPIFASGAAIRSDQSLDITNNVQINGGVASNGNVNLFNSVEICGNATAGPGKRVSFANSAALCPGYVDSVAPTTFSLPVVDQGNATTVNDNARIGTADPWVNQGTSSWDPSTRVLDLRNQAQLTLSGNVYSFCRLILNNNSQLMIASRTPGTAVRIYMDSPEHCGAGTGSIDLRNNSTILNLNPMPTTLQIYSMGSPTMGTQVNFDNSFDSDLNIVINAPYSSINVRNNVHLTGAIQAKAINLSNHASVTWHDDAGTLSSGSVFRVYRRQDWIDCLPTPTAAAPDSGC